MKLSMVVLFAALSSLAGCSTTQSNPVTIKPVSALSEGKLLPVQALDSAVENRSIVVRQAWAGINNFGVQDVVVYLNESGTAKSNIWSHARWSVSGNRLCFNNNSTMDCYRALSDDSGQSFLQHEKTNILKRVVSIEIGDSRNVEHMYAKLVKKQKEQRQAQQAQAQAIIAMFGLLASAAGTSSGYDDTQDKIAARQDRKADRELMKSLSR